MLVLQMATQHAVPQGQPHMGNRGLQKYLSHGKQLMGLADLGLSVVQPPVIDSIGTCEFVTY